MTILETTCSVQKKHITLRCTHLSIKQITSFSYSINEKHYKLLHNTKIMKTFKTSFNNENQVYALAYCSAVLKKKITTKET